LGNNGFTRLGINDADPKNSSYAAENYNQDANPDKNPERMRELIPHFSDPVQDAFRVGFGELACRLVVGLHIIFRFVLCVV